jgi:predicted amidophosphoribosyltransferase
VTTPCGHTFCKKCIEKALNKISQCPLCNYETNIDKLHIAYSIQEIVEEYEKMKEQYQSENDVVLSQAPIEHLSNQDLVEQSLSRTSRNF